MTSPKLKVSQRGITTNTRKLAERDGERSLSVVAGRQTGKAATPSRLSDTKALSLTLEVLEQHAAGERDDVCTLTRSLLPSPDTQHRPCQK